MRKNEHSTDLLEVKKICDIVCNIRGIPEGSITTDAPKEIAKSHEEKYALPRAVASNVSRLHGRIHQETIAEVLGRHRTSIYAYQRIHEQQLNSWQDYRKLFEKTLQKYEQYKKSYHTFIDKEHLLEHLKNHNIKISEKPNAYIHITTSQFKIKLNTDLKYCGTNMEIIRICTKDYDIKKILLKIDEKFTK